MKKTRNTALFTVVCLLSTLTLSAQLKKDAVKKQAAKPTEAVVSKVDTIKPTGGDLLKNAQNAPAETPKPNNAPTQSGDELLESIKRDIKQEAPPITENEPEKILPTVEQIAISTPLPPKAPKIRKPLRPYHHELQLEAGAFLNQGFRVFGLVKEGTPYNASPYFIGYKYKLSTKSMEGAAIRVGFGGFFDRKEETPGNLKDTKQLDTSAISGRLGFEFQRNIGDNFRWLFGADAILQNNQKRIFADSGVDQVTDKTSGFTKGFGLMMGIRWDFTDRASIGSEMNLQFLNFQGEQTLKFTANPQFDKVIRRVNNTSTAYLGPANVYISWRF